jgi:DNA-binding NarL/FixJ family response regulator
MEKILIADDHPLVRGALALAVEAAFGRAEILESASLHELVGQLEKIGVADLVLLDLRMPGVDGFGGLLRLRTNFPETPVVVISAHEDRRLVKEAIALGAAGFIPKSTPRQEIVGALHRIAAGEVYVPADTELVAAASAAAGGELDVAQRLATLTAQQVRVLQLLGTGKLNKEIAYELDIAEPTVKVHVSAILQKLKVYSRTQAAVLAGRLLSNEPLRDGTTRDGAGRALGRHERQVS